MKTSEDVLIQFANDPFPALYNIIYATMYPRKFKINERG